MKFTRSYTGDEWYSVNDLDAKLDINKRSIRQCLNGLLKAGDVVCVGMRGRKGMLWKRSS